MLCDCEGGQGDVMCLGNLSCDIPNRDRGLEVGGAVDRAIVQEGMQTGSS